MDCPPGNRRVPETQGDEMVYVVRDGYGLLGVYRSFRMAKRLVDEINSMVPHCHPSCEPRVLSGQIGDAQPREAYYVDDEDVWTRGLERARAGFWGRLQ